MSQTYRLSMGTQVIVLVLKPESGLRLVFPSLNSDLSTNRRNIISVFRLKPEHYTCTTWQEHTHTYIV